MPRAKIQKKATHVDMTAMCDVAFLLLTFFILAAQFKPSSAVEVITPNSVSNKHAPEINYFTVTIDKDNNVYVDMWQTLKAPVLKEVGELTNMQFSPADIKAFENTEFVGLPLSQIKQYDALSAEQKDKVKLSGIPYDSTNNQLLTWITAAVKASEGKQTSFLIKGDNATKYTTFKKVLDAFQKNDIYKYNLMTNAEEVPEGSELWKKNMRRIRSGEKPE